MNKKTRICLCTAMLICVIILSGAESSGVPTVSASSLTSESIREKEEQIARAREDKENLQSGLTDLKKIKQDLESRRSDLKSYVTELDRNLDEIQLSIENLNAEISEKEDEIILTQKELDAARRRENDQKESICYYIRTAYETGGTTVIDILLTSSDFGDFLNRADYLEKVLTYQNMLWESYIISREYVELCAQQLELEKEILDQTKANVEEQQHNIEDLIDQKTRDIIEYETDINTKEKAIRELEEDIKAQDEEIAALEAAVAEEKKRILAQNGSVLIYDNGEFKFPLASYTRVSDEYGMRIHPILGVEQFHNGVDFAAPKGTAIYAAYDGRVAAADYSSSMGNYVMIDHGSELYTIYMHASEVYVKKGDIVVKGETIAAVGSTGRSTGNHLHFSVRLNGEYVSPWNYLK